MNGWTSGSLIAALWIYNSISKVLHFAKLLYFRQSHRNFEVLMATSVLKSFDLHIDVWRPPLLLDLDPSFSRWISSLAPFLKLLLHFRRLNTSVAPPFCSWIWTPGLAGGFQVWLHFWNYCSTFVDSTPVLHHLFHWHLLWLGCWQVQGVTLIFKPILIYTDMCSIQERPWKDKSSLSVQCECMPHSMHAIEAHRQSVMLLPVSFCWY